jgi:two-component system, cell cycle sensor histidine kinase and response regulator CckA
MEGALIRVLLVEDNPGDVRLLRETLQDVRDANVEIAYVMTLEEGLQRAAAGNIDVILLDLTLPDTSGVQTVTRTVTAVPEVPIVVLTGLADEQAAVRALREGAQDYLVKGQGDGQLVLRAMRYAIERKRAQIEREHLEAQLQSAQRLESLGVLAGGIAHDFNNLLTIITCNAQFVHTSVRLDKAQETALQDLETAAGHATELTRSLLAFSRPTKPQAKPIDLNVLVSDVYRFLRRVLPAIIEFRLDCDSRPCISAVDPGQMQQVLVNLCVNARDAMPTGGVLEIQTRHLARRGLPAHLKSQARGDEYVCLRVSDTGTGMDADTLRQIFDPFFTTKPKDRGTGLGLAIVYKIVEVHKGMIDVASQLGQGTHFDIYFPAATLVPDSARPDLAATKGRERLLILDDEEMIASLMKTVLESRGYHVTVTHQPEAALKFARTCGPGLDLAVVDYSMPAMTGDQVLAEIRRPHPDLRAILVTGDPAAVPEHQDALTRVLAKPFTATALAAVVRELLDKKK